MIDIFKTSTPFTSFTPPQVKIGDVRKRRFSLIDRSGGFCPVCGCLVTDLAAHTSEMNDDDHVVAEVMES